MDALIHHLGAVLKEAREDAGLTQEDVSKRSPLKMNTLGRLERGTNKAYWPREPEKMVEIYAKLCGVDPLEIWEAAISRARKASKKRS